MMNNDEQNSTPCDRSPADAGDDRGAIGAGEVDPEDPRLTAYALGELNETERKLVDEAIGASEELGATVEEIRRQASILRDDLERRLGSEKLAEARRERVLATARRISWRTEPVAQEPRPLSARLRLSERELAFFWSGIGAAAAVLVMLVWQAATIERGGPRQAAVGTGPDDESQVMVIDFLGDGESNEPRKRLRRIPSSLPGPSMAGWQAPAEDSGAGGVAAAGVRASTSFPLWIDDASFRAGREALLTEGRLPATDGIRVEEWIAAVHGDGGPDSTGPASDRAMRVSRPVAEGITMVAEVASAPWQPDHELVMLKVVLEEQWLADFQRGARVFVEPNPAAVDAFRILGFDRAVDTDRPSSTGDERDEPDFYVVTALAELRRTEQVAGGDLLRFKLEPVAVGSEIVLPVLSVPARPEGAPDIQLASRDFQAAAAAAELGLMLTGKLGSDGYHRLADLTVEGGLLDEPGPKRDLAAMIRVAAELEGVSP